MKGKFKISKKTLLVVGIISTLIILTSIAYVVQSDSICKIFGKNQSAILALNEDSTVATIDDIKITKKGFDTYKLMVNNGPNKLSDKEILDKIVDRQVIYQEALSQGITASDEEVAAAIESAKADFNSSSEQQAAFQDYISGLNMTEEQYWESVKPAYQKAIICGKFINALKDKFATDNKIEDRTERDTKFKPFYDQYVKDLKKTKNITYLLH